MICDLGIYINKLLTENELSQAEIAREIHVSRQIISYVISGKREMSLQLAIKMENYFSLPEGQLMKILAVQDIKRRKQSIRNQLCTMLVDKNAFWSYDPKDFSLIPDEEIIEKCFTLLDMKDIELMFEIYPRKYIQKVWRENMATQGEYMQMLNIMIAMYYFGIKEPEKYLAKAEKQHIKKLLKQTAYASGINS